MAKRKVKRPTHQAHRKIKNPADERCCPVQIRLTQAERDYLEKQAIKAGTSATHIVTQLTLSTMPQKIRRKV